MASYDPRLAAAGDARLTRHLHLSWSALFGGGLIGWATLFVLSLAGASIGLATLNASSRASVVGERLANIGLGVGIWGLVAMLIASFIGAFCVVRIAGERRRREGLLHGAVSWGLSAAALGLMVLFAAGGAASTASQSAALNRSAIARNTRAREAVRGEPGTARLTPSEQAAVENTAENTAKAAGATAGALALSLILALAGALVACSLTSGKTFSDELRPRRRQHEQERRAMSMSMPGAARSDMDLRERDLRGEVDQPTILPPTH